MKNTVMLICLIGCLIMTPLHIIKGSVNGAMWGLVGIAFSFISLMLD